ncbi:MAG TPA: hypothetical protein DIW31_09115 [Bacteroidales bacterium]|nr:hypothetical protein [Bacteroidales bacterium]
MFGKIIFFISLIISTVHIAFGQQNPSNMYVDSIGQVYVKTDVPAYFFVAPADNNATKYIIPTNDARTNPMIFEDNGLHYIQTTDATNKPVTFKIFADGIAPKISIKFKKGLLMSSGKRFYVDEGSIAELIAKDNYSGVQNIFVSVDGSEFTPTKIVSFEKVSDYQVKAYAIDNVGNVSDTVSYRVITAVNAIVKINNIYFDINSNRLRPESKEELNEFVQVLNEYPEIKIEIRAHTDSQGDSQYNLQLSERRAEAVVEYLIQRGIYNNRLSFKGFGDTMLVNECTKGVDCSDEKHQENRRVEFRILPMK